MFFRYQIYGGALLIGYRHRRVLKIIRRPRIKWEWKVVNTQITFINTTATVPTVRNADELLPVYVVLRTPLTDEESVQSYFSQLSITVEAHASGTAVSAAPDVGAKELQQAPLAKDLLYSMTIAASQEPLVVISRSGAEAPVHSESFVFAVWRVNIPLTRPRVRLQKPSIYFTANAVLNSAEQTRAGMIEGQYLPSGVPASINLLECFRDDPALAGVKPRLSAARVQKIAPVAAVSENVLRPLKSSHRRSFRAGPALVSRIRYSRLGHPVKSTVIASLDLEVTSFAGCDVTVEEVSLGISDGRAEPCTGLDGLGLPLTCKPGDETTILYRLSPARIAGQTTTDNQTFHVLEINTIAHVLISEDCHPQINIRWRANVDLAPPAPSLLGNSNRRTSSQSLAFRLPGRDSIPSVDDNSLRPSPTETSNATNITLTFAGPPVVHVGETFRWDVSVVNRSPKPRRLALLALPRRRRGSGVRGHKPLASIATAISRDEHGADAMAEAVLDESVVYAMQKNGTQEPTGLVCLSPDVRIGPLASSACFTTELKFLVLTPGVLHLEALRVVDLDTKEVMDVRNLPDIIALERSRES
ncbi:hypothetical protein B0A49_03561 [Cryomyces minteri]|uniref:Trafficking protein particle complex II-specific subunit 65 IgD3 domain-containing protein n=1 Tax=Cryomyces minteri TaxID=331657 RepID=A0A4U0XCX8_9PEZI|nr:hypothetical protein B0A49_03561 [Cryomyces minteri]